MAASSARSSVFILSSYARLIRMGRRFAFLFLGAALLLAAHQVGGIAVGGRRYPVELKVYDTRGNAAEGASAMQRLASVDNVPVVLGEVLAGAAAAEAPIAQDNELPFILTVSTAPNLTEQANRYLFR